MPELVGQELGVSGWIRVDQAMIDQFAECTGDKQWIHVDRERSAREAPAGTTIAHGFLTLSLLPVMSYELDGLPEGIHAAFNYGLDKLRFLAPVKAGARIRLRTVLAGFDEKGPGRYLMRRSNTIEIEGEDKPALITDTLALLVAKEDT
ncbi:MAG: MaoC family dehydratase [Rhizobiaceae bacterium]|nr:MaoC family dehydratase [Rhizobiaceae bacterium]